MFAAFLGGWEIVLLLGIAGVIGILFVVTLIVVLLVNLPKLRAKQNVPPSQPLPMQHGGQ
jgi:hypothetical protein